MTKLSPTRSYAAEFFGTALLLMAIIGSGVMGERLASGNMAIALLANSISVGCALVVLILAFGPISGAHFNPAVSLVDAWQRGLPWRFVPGYLIAQLTGAVFGVACAHLMFAIPVFQQSSHARSGSAQAFSEFVATFGLLLVIWGCARARTNATPYAVGLYIVSAFWFTASTSFANPAVTLARAFSDTFAGIRLQDVLPFTLAQLAGAFAATGLMRWFYPLPNVADRVLVEHDEETVGV